jgi:hypothetical protein
MKAGRTEAAFLGVLLAALAAVQSVGLTRPFLRQHESVGTEVGKHARNHLKFGLPVTRGLKLDVSGPSLAPYPDPRRYYYPNHPPFPPLLIAASFALFGPSEAAYRATLLLCSLGAVLLFRRVALRLLPAPYDRAATVIFAFLPTFAYYSIVTAQQVTMLLGALSSLHFYLRWSESGLRRHYAGLLASIAFACSCAWAGYYVAPALLAAHVRSGLPRTRAVAALLGFNVLLFGLYLFHLWIASPPDLDPIRKLFSAGAARSSVAGPALPIYLFGEARELALMLTVPALALAAVWAASLLHRRVERTDRLLLALPLLGLDEAVFANVAANHEYFSYPLAVFAALAAGRGLAALGAFVGARRAPLAAPAAAVALALVLAQSAWVLQRRLTREGGYVFYHRLGLALRTALPPDARVLLLTRNIPFYTPFYGDVFTVWYDAPGRELVPENSGGRKKDVGPEQLLELLRKSPPDFDVVVTAEKESARRSIDFLRSLDDAQLMEFGVETGPTPLRSFLEGRCGPPREHGGFLFWSLK